LESQNLVRAYGFADDKNNHKREKPNGFWRQDEQFQNSD
jgi:hypothetical protein